MSPNVSLSDQCAAGGGWHDTFAPDASYPERRIPLEAQEWFLPLGAQPGRSTGHTHLETCAPVGAVSNQDMRLDLRLRLHLGANIPAVNPSTVVKINEVEIRGRNSYGRDVLVDQFILGGNRSFLTLHGREPVRDDDPFRRARPERNRRAVDRPARLPAHPAR